MRVAWIIALVVCCASGLAYTLAVLAGRQKANWFRWPLLGIGLAAWFVAITLAIIMEYQRGGE